jgi:xanthine dehydrogenase accessory factor
MRSILILGGSDIGSAIAHRLFFLGVDAVVRDEEAPAHTRRGMAFTEAWFGGTAMLDGVPASLGRSIEDLQDLRSEVGVVPVTCLATDALRKRLAFDALVDARMRKRAIPEDLRELAPLTVGLGPNFVPGKNCHIAIETAWGDGLGAVLRDQRTEDLAGEPRPIGEAGRERFVYSPQDGIWRTGHRIGQAVIQGESVGTLNGIPVAAPLTGRLRGLPHDSVAVGIRQKIIEVDPRQPAEIFGLGERPRTIARGVSIALGLGTGLENAFFGFESDYRKTLDCVPMRGRYALDQCRLKLSLTQWRGLPRAVRETVIEADAGNQISASRLAGYLLRWIEKQELGAVERCNDNAALQASQSGQGMLESVAKQLAATVGSRELLRGWPELEPIQRYSLVKLAAKGHRNFPRAVEEFLRVS